MGQPGELVNWLLRHAPIGAMVLGIADAARDEEQRKTGLIGFCLGVLALVVWAVVRVIEKMLRDFGLGS